MNDSYLRLHGYFIEDLEAGMSAELSKAFTEEDLELYARLSTDDNPLHMDESFAARARTGGRILHGMVTASLISAIIGTRLPGPGCLWMEHETRFRAPVRIGDRVHARAVITDVDREKQRVRMLTESRAGGRTVVEGAALVWVPSRAGSGGCLEP